MDELWYGRITFSEEDDVMAPVGNMIVDIGGGTTEVAAISLGGIVHASSIRIAGNQITHDIVDYMAKQYNLRIGFKTAEQIKHKIGSVLMDLPSDDPLKAVARGTCIAIEDTYKYKFLAR